MSMLIMNFITNHFLIIGKVWPEPDSSAAGNRMMQLIHELKSAGYSITFACAAGESDFMADLDAAGVNTVSIKLNDVSFDVFVKELKPDVVIFDRFITEEQFGWRVTEQCPDALRILDTEDLHCLRYARQLAWKEGREMSYSDLHSDVAYRETASVWRSDLSLIISEYEFELLRTFFKVDTSLLLYLPFMLNKLKKHHQEAWPDFKTREHFISIGNFLHEPNWNAVLFLKEEIWPLIRKKIPRAELHIYGAYASEKVKQLHNQKEGFLIKGRAGDAHEVIQKARVMLAPLRFGAGLKGKLIDAMQCGTPSVTTNIGAEGMNRNLPWAGKIADNVEESAQAAVDLYQNEAVWKASQKQGIEIINSQFNRKEWSSKLFSKVDYLRMNINEHRIQNFTGRMLQHHSLASTKFMGKWIEEKNKKF